METIKVNMNPNPLDVQTIHASQNDGEAREWEFELHNNGDVIDASEISDQLVFKAYKGGTEQILPENTSTPTTSPFKGDIRYPQGLLADQEFTYRQSPTESDGLAKITDIKGNTLVWNQLVRNDAAATTINGVTYTKSGNKWSASGTVTEAVAAQVINATSFGLKNGHKYLCKGCPNGGSNNTYYFGISGIPIDTGNGGIWTSTYADGTVAFPRFDVRQGTTVNFTDMQFICVDLTQMFGPGNEPTTVEEFTSLFSLPYYAYNQGSLLSFMGNGIKTVGKNLCTRTTESNIYNAGNLIPIKKGQTIYWGGVWTGGSMWSGIYLDKDERNKNNKVQTGRTINSDNVSFITSDYDGYFGICFNGSVTSYTVEKMMIAFDLFTLDEYEPYTSSTLSLPISTYFPTGMKSAGSVYDELTPKKAITRIGAVDLGSVTWAYNSTDARFYANINEVKPSPTSGTAFSSGMVTVPYQTIFTDAPVSFGNMLSYIADKDMLIWQYTTGGGVTNVNIKDTRYTDATTFKSAMSGVYLYYELATPTETPITTASLVTENAEIPLSNEDGTLIGKCTEELSAEPGFHDAKIKLSDSDGTCYSNKLQLHVERSPQ